jgi:hypothetical protein
MESSSPNVAFRRDLLGPRIVSWNALLLQLANVYLQIGYDEFHWNLYENDNFSVDYIYNALIQHNVLVGNN